MLSIDRPMTQEAQLNMRRGVYASETIELTELISRLQEDIGERLAPALLAQQHDTDGLDYLIEDKVYGLLVIGHLFPIPNISLGGEQGYIRALMLKDGNLHQTSIQENHIKINVWSMPNKAKLRTPLLPSLASQKKTAKLVYSRTWPLDCGIESLEPTAPEYILTNERTKLKLVTVSAPAEESPSVKSVQRCIHMARSYRQRLFRTFPPAKKPGR